MNINISDGKFVEKGSRGKRETNLSRYNEMIGACVVGPILMCLGAATVVIKNWSNLRLKNENKRR